ncbi:MAG TPA: DUF948 domain-containing protein [Armatimonadaceae bacterium]|nr:DUF948 domain-containing protein [Armatimonadaceae bacterium]
MQLNPVASTVVVAFFLVLSVILVGLLAALIIIMARLNAKLEEVTTRVDPLLNRVETLMVEANDRLNTIGDKAEVILTQGEAVATTVHDRVDRTATAVTRTVNAPLIGINSIAAGLSAGWEAFTHSSRRRADSRLSPYALPPFGLNIPKSAGPVERLPEPGEEESRELAEARVGTTS